MVGRREEGDGADRLAHMAVMCEREGVSAGVRKVEENTPFRKYANAAWAERGAGACGVEWASAGWGWARCAEI
jgi:hypothetical protein